MTARCPLKPGWRKVTLGGVATNSTKATKDPEGDGFERYIVGKDIPPDGGPITTWSPVGDGLFGSRIRTIVEDGDVICTTRGPNLRVARSTFRCLGAHTNFVLRTVTEQELLQDYLALVVESDGFQQHLRRSFRGSVNLFVNWSDAAKYEFALPSLDEQKRIVELVVASDSARLSYEKVAACAATGMNAARQELISEDYQADTRRLVEVASVALGRVYPSSEYAEAGMRLLRPGNIAPGGRLSWTSSVYLRPEWANESGSVLVGPGDVIMNLTAQTLDDGFLGRVCLAGVDDEAIMNQRIARLRSEEVLPAYLCAVLQHGRFRRHVAMSAKGSKIKHLYERDFADFPVPVPSLARQQEVISRLQHLDSVSRLAESTERRSAGLRRALMEDSLRGTSA